MNTPIAMTDENAWDVSRMVEQVKYGRWEEVFSILDRKRNLINCIPDLEERAWGVLHQAAWWQDEGTVEKLLYQYPTYDSEIKIKQDQANASGPGKTPEWIARTLKGNKKLQTSILENKRNERFGGDIPTYVTYQEGEKNRPSGATIASSCTCKLQGNIPSI